MTMKDSFENEISRRRFIAKVGKGFVAANVAGTFLKAAAAKEVAAADSPGSKLGWAIVGLGNLAIHRSEEHTSELQSRLHLACRLLLAKQASHTNPDIASIAALLTGPLRTVEPASAKHLALVEAARRLYRANAMAADRAAKATAVPGSK